ncbi:MAG: 50S ribosomal protein L6 [Sandaracinus sp.]
MAEATQNAPRVSRVGKKPIALPAGVTLTAANGKLSVKGPKGTLERPLHADVDVVKDGNNIVIKAKASSGDEGARLQGLTRALVKNVLDGVATGYKISLDLIGTGYRAEVKGQDLTLALGYSHPVSYKLPVGVTAQVETIDVAGTKKPRLHLSSADKELLGQTAARVRSFRPPEPYKGKGVRYVDEKIREKAGKAGGKGKK